MQWNAQQTSWGSAYGTINMDGDEEEDGCDSDESENNDYEYFCPECEHSLPYNFFEEEDEEDEEEEEIEINTEPTIKPESEGDDTAGHLDTHLYENKPKEKDFAEFMQECGYAEADDEATTEELSKIYPKLYKDFKAMYN